ncbi:sugar phosphate permease [Pseudomonas sp. GM78]|uniref:MFS transporter n=1 Tax=Pseudomonas sp. GM78 TaxID=1144337 RepID=UPI00026FB993|nr:MFS transporter [Pseudomonas sp. GM78]EJN35059.1 sugar phosphate permease [Pseudomonas sp. GM78]
MSITQTLDVDNARSASALRNGYTVGLFFLCFVFSYIDRQIVSILVQPIKATLALSDTQIGLLQGFAFTLCYATAGVVVARLVDRTHRVRLIAVCVAIWALCTALCATADSFSELLFWRAGTAIAEAGLSPAVLSIFADLYSPRKVSRPTSIFMLGPYIGSGVALAGGGLLLGWLSHTEGVISVLGVALHPWQFIFLTVGLAGLPLAFLVAFSVREPARTETRALASAEVAEQAPPMMEVLKELFVRNRFCTLYFLAYMSLITLFYSHTAWFATLLIRKYAMEASQVGKLAGPLYMLGGICGVMFARYLGSRMSDQQTVPKALKTSALASCALIPLALFAPLLPTFGWNIGAYALCAFSASIVMALAPIPVQVAIPNRMRGRSIALLVFLTNIVGGGIGPFAVGYLTQSMPGVENSLGIALSGVGVTAALLSTLLYFMAARRAQA